MGSELTFLMSGIVFGLSAGISPGPLFMLVITETLHYSKNEGIKVACTPLITDVPIILVTVLIFSKLSHLDFLMGLISICGGFFIGYLAYENITVKRAEIRTQNIGSQSLKKGIITNFLNPHPYLFWFAVGAPTVVKALDINLFSTVLFIAGFYVCLVGSKIVAVAVVERSRSFIRGKIYICTIRFLGVLLLIFSVWFLLDGVTLLGIL